MRSSYKTTLKSLLKSGEVFTASFLQSLFHFYGPSGKSGRSPTAGTEKEGSIVCAAAGSDIRRGCLRPGSAKDTALQREATWLVCASGPTAVRYR